MLLGHPKPYLSSRGVFQWFTRIRPELMKSFLFDCSTSQPFQNKSLLSLASMTYASPAQSNALYPSPAECEAPASYRIISSDSFSTSRSPDFTHLYNIPNLGFNLDENDLIDVGPHLTGSSAPISHSYNRLSITEPNRHELDISRSIVSTAQDQSSLLITHDEPSLFGCTHQPIVEGPDDGQLDGRLTDHSDPIEEHLDSGDDTDEDYSNSKNRNISTGKSNSRKAQGVLLSIWRVIIISRTYADTLLSSTESADISSDDDDTNDDFGSPKMPIQKEHYVRQSVGSHPAESGKIPHSRKLDGRSSRSRNTNTLPSKRRRSPSASTRLGSKENPIEVDKVASLFEPIVGEYVWAFLL